MSQEIKQPATNIYGVLDNELDRMHELFRLYLTMPSTSSGNYGGGGTYTQNNMGHGQIPILYKRIGDLQDALLKIAVSHDALVQDRVAELALTGVAK